MRVATAVAANEPEEKRTGRIKEFYNLMSGFRYVPGGRILHALGADANVTAQNCYVLPSPEDSRAGIMSSLTQWVEIQARGGGVGINISSLRPRNAPVKGVNGTSSGPISWAQIFAYMTKEIIQQGGSRRGAAMIMMDVSHPDIREFIHAKETPGVLEGANVSVCIDDAFMDAVATDGDYELRWGEQSYGRVRATKLWNEICTAAWASGEPGIYFMEHAQKDANSGYFETLVATSSASQ